MHRSMDNLEQLSDAELRHRLLQYGFPNLPVTDTTRKVLIKKLRNHMNNEKAKLRRETTFATRYSSDEESDLDSKRKISKNVINSKSRSPQNFNHNNMPPPVSTIVSRRVTSPTSSPKTSLVNDMHQQRHTSRIYVPPPIIANDTDEDSDYINYKQQTSVNSRLSTSPTLSTSNYGFTADRVDRVIHNDSWNRNYSSSSPFYNSTIGAETHSYTNGHSSSHESPYSSDFTRRLLNLRGETIRDSVYSNDNTRTSRSLAPLTPDPTEIVHQQPEPRTEFNISPSKAFSNLIIRLDEQYGVKQTLIPCILLSALIVFFALVAFMYMTISPDLANTINEKNTQYSLCTPESSNSAIATATYTCVEKGSIDSALRLLRFVAPELQKRAEQNKCTDRSAVFTMSAKEVIRLAQPADVRKTLKDLHNMEYLIEKNPQWKINHVDIDGNPLSFDQVVQLRSTQGNHFAILNPRLPFSCSLYNKLQTFFLLIGGCGILLLVAGGIYVIYRLLINYQQSNREKVTYFIDEIITALMRKAAIDPDQSSIVLKHLHDKLVPLHKRKELEWAWNEAMKYLENSESRIQFSVGVRNGEDCKLIKWIDTVSPEQIGQRSTVKKWHSPAFDKTNKIANPPTPCLKIRQMFDKFEANNPNLKTIIQDAILEKVGPNCKIYDIQLDKQSCCVYVRCATVMDAGIVHNEINGWWFDKRLVSIKFLRLERYLNRFPKSSSGPTCLRPSNTKNLSMSQCSKDCGTMNGIDDDDDDEDIDDDN